VKNNRPHNQSNRRDQERSEQPDATARDADFFRDRLLHLALSEQLGEQTPPDLSARILDAASEQAEAETVVTSTPNHRARHRQLMQRKVWCLVAGAGVALLLLCVTAMQFTDLPQIATPEIAARVAPGPVGRVLYPAVTPPLPSLRWPPRDEDLFAPPPQLVLAQQNRTLAPVRKLQPSAGVTVHISGASTAVARGGLQRWKQPMQRNVVFPAAAYVTGEQIHCVQSNGAALTAASQRASVATTSYTPPAGQRQQAEELRPLAPPLTVNAAWLETQLLTGGGSSVAATTQHTEIQVDGFRARVCVTYGFSNAEASAGVTFKAALPCDASLNEFSYRDQTAAAGSYQYVVAEGPLKRERLWRKCTAEIAPAVADDIFVSHCTESPAVAASGRSGFVSCVAAPVLPDDVQNGAPASQPRVITAQLDGLPAGVQREVTVGYEVNLKYDGAAYVLRHPLAPAAGSVRLTVQTPAGAGYQITPPASRVSQRGSHVEFEYLNSSNDDNSNDDNSNDDNSNDGGAIELRLDAGPSTVLAADGYFAAAIQPALPDADDPVASHAVFLLDTSLSGRAHYRRRLQLIEEILRQNRLQIKQFAVLLFNIEQQWWRRSFTANTPANVQQLLESCGGRLHEGATDLRQALAAAAAPGWSNRTKSPPADLFLLSDGGVTWGESNLQQIAAPLLQGNVRSLFAFDHHGGGGSPAVETLAAMTGGNVIPAATADDQKTAATAYRNRPWRIVDVQVEGGRDLLLPGGDRTLLAGGKLLIAGRGAVTGSTHIVMKLQRGKATFDYNKPVGAVIRSPLAARVFGLAASQQMAAAGASADVVVAFSRQQNIAGSGTSLVLPFQQSDTPHSGRTLAADTHVVTDAIVSQQIRTAEESAARQAADPRSFFLGCLERATQSAGLGYQVPEALRTALENQPATAFASIQAPVSCEIQLQSEVPPSFEIALRGATQSASADFEDQVYAEAQRRRSAASDDALRALSTLVESQAGNVDLLVDVAHTVMNWGAAENAYPLLQKLLVHRPADPRVYHAMARCGWQLGRSDIAIVCYEVLTGATWPEKYGDITRASQAEYLHLLRRIRARRSDCFAHGFAMQRLDEFNSRLPFQNAELVVTAWWSQAASDVNLLVAEPGGESCYFDNRQTRNGGWLSKDAKQAGGPEMYVLKAAAPGEYQVSVNCRPAPWTTSGQKQATSVYISAYAGFATSQHLARYRTLKVAAGEESSGVLKIFVDNSGGVSFSEAAEYSSE